MHSCGKNLCDSEFARLKIKLDREFVAWLKENEEQFTKNAAGIHEFCEKKLKEWSCNGEQVKERKYHLREDNEEEFEDFVPLKNVKCYRCVMWDQEGNFYRRNNSCSCEACVVRPLNSSTPTECLHNLSGPWTFEDVFPKPFSDSDSETIQHYKKLHTHTHVYKQLYNTVQQCTQLYKTAHSYSKLYKTLHNYIKLYNTVQHCNKLYKMIQT